MGKLLPLIFLIVGTAIGGGVGMAVKPEPKECPDISCEDMAASETGAEVAEPNYIAMKNQFVVPVIQKERVQSLVVLSLSLEAVQETAELVFSKEPKLRDAFLRVLFDHAHNGGFNGAFTESGRLSVLRIALLEAAQSVVGDEVSDILITEIVRQEM